MSAERSSIVCFGFLELTGLVHQPTEVDVRVRVVGIEAQGLTVSFHCSGAGRDFGFATNFVPTIRLGLWCRVAREWLELAHGAHRLWPALQFWRSERRCRLQLRTQKIEDPLTRLGVPLFAPVSNHHLPASCRKADGADRLLAVELLAQVAQRAADPLSRDSGVGEAL